MVKADRVAAYASNVIHEVSIIAHSCGVIDPHRLGREHAYIVNDEGSPEPLNKHYPEAATLPQYRTLAETA